MPDKVREAIAELERIGDDVREIIGRIEGIVRRTGDDELRRVAADLREIFGDKTS